MIHEMEYKFVKATNVDNVVNKSAVFTSIWVEWQKFFPHEVNHAV